ncbi:MAG TPA: hypothetical protein VGK58_03725 [Lacipirellulaceae bacterium]
MYSNLRVVAAILAVLPSVVMAAAPIELELATERGVQITAPREWLQLLTAVGIDNVQIRGIRSGDEPRVENRGTAERPRYHVVGILTSRHQLQLPGGTFSRGDRAKLKDYFERLTADGAESLTAPRGRFGLAEKEMTAVLADLAQPIEFPTKGQPARDVMERMQAKFKARLALDAKAAQALRDTEPCPDELKGLTAGTGLAILLRTSGLALRPEKSRGQPVVYRIEPVPAEAINENTLGKADDDDVNFWPIGWEPHETPGELAPSLFEYRNAEVSGFTLEETLAAIGERVKTPIYVDHAALAEHRIDPAKIQVQLARTRTIYKRVIDRVLAQAKLGSQIRVDEAGTPFLWITR